MSLWRARMTEPAVSAAEEELFGGALRYDAAWSEHERSRVEVTLLSALRSMPRLVGATVKRAWRADRSGLVVLGIAEVGQGIAAAIGLLIVNSVMHALLGGGSAPERLHQALPAVVAGACAAVIRSLFAGLSTSRAGRLEPLVERIAQVQYLKAAAEVELEAIEDPEFKRLMDVAQFGVDASRRMISACIAALNGVISLVSAAGVLSVLDVRLLPMLLLIAAPRAWGAMRVAQERYVSRLTWVEHLRASRLLGNLLTERTAAQEVRVHQVGPFLLTKYEQMATTAESEQRRLATRKAMIELLAASMSGVATALTYAAVYGMITAGWMSLAVAGTAILAIRSGSASLGSLVMNLNQLNEESLYVRDHEAFVTGAVTRTIPHGGEPLASRLGSVELEKVSYRYPDREHAALHEVSLRLEMGRVVAVVGENGSGKSTLMKVLSGLVSPAGGTVRFGRQHLADVDRRQVFARVSVLTQDFQRWPLTAAMNLRIGRPEHPHTDDALMRSLRHADADRLWEKFPAGWQSLLGRMFRGSADLSGGEWQRIGLARTHWRTITQDADSVLIVDEPTSALDPETEIEAFRRVRALASPHRVVVLVTHRMSGVRHADMIHVLHQGHLVESGSHQELMARPDGRYRAMFLAQAAEYASIADDQVPGPRAGAPTPRGQSS
ncbi:multidrug ABC transporter permease [Streptomyces xanthochromogenes]|uniref:ATP-binding cassette domain-containing protein n=1 Tax=Streptomyces xanthochromogenes TaxID=67384 RepID=UPI0016735C8C|nr:ABC transporter ATP-binding protein [Streptomyces xanthochromogenes]GHB77935.1 multidrug ABC transporter permease [Streptomyces xanthochromogenes]